jgi:hypothetical protein
MIIGALVIISATTAMVGVYALLSEEWRRLDSEARAEACFLCYLLAVIAAGALYASFL